MGLLPTEYAARIAFFKSRISIWTAEATNIGTTTASVTALNTAVTNAETALAGQETARNAAKTATENLRQMLAAMDNLGMGIVEQVRTKSRTAGDGVFVLADLPVPATPSAKGNPGTPYDLKLTLDPDGTLNLGWKCNNPAGTSGTIYQVERKIGATGAFEYLGGTGKKSFVDDTIPAGATRLTYQIRGVRSTAVGVAAEFVVNFGTNAAGEAFATLAEQPAARIAA